MEIPLGTIDFWAMAIYFGGAMLLASGIIGLSYLLGQRHRDSATGEPYESGIAVDPAAARGKISIRYYLIAIFFVIFDLEAAFIFVWAVAFRQLGWQGYVAILIFILVLLAGLLYLVRQGAFDFAARRPNARTGSMGPHGWARK